MNSLSHFPVRPERSRGNGPSEAEACERKWFSTSLGKNGLGMVILADADATDAAGRALAPYIKVGDVIALSGDLGAGKSSFARGVMAALGLAGEAPSPSFALVIPYAPPELSIPIWHVDLYRLEQPDEIAELGLDEARGDAALIIEWPEQMGARLWPDALKLRLDPHADGGRILTVDAPPSWEDRCPFR